jgi:hypothetical protein
VEANGRTVPNESSIILDEMDTLAGAKQDQNQNLTKFEGDRYSDQDAHGD